MNHSPMSRMKTESPAASANPVDPARSKEMINRCLMLRVCHLCGCANPINTVNRLHYRASPIHGLHCRASPLSVLRPRPNSPSPPPPHSRMCALLSSSSLSVDSRRNWTESRQHAPLLSRLCPNMCPKRETMVAAAADWHPCQRLASPSTISNRWGACLPQAIHSRTRTLPWTLQ